MIREYFMETSRIGFSKWNGTDFELAVRLWGEKDVTRYICASGEFTEQDIRNRLDLEISNDEQFSVQYWPVFELATGGFIGCCGLRPYKTDSCSYELGFHLRREYWGKGYACEAAEAAICYGFDILKAAGLYAGHHPGNAASEKLLKKLGFLGIGRDFYGPTGLYHPLYELRFEDFQSYKE